MSKNKDRRVKRRYSDEEPPNRGVSPDTAHSGRPRPNLRQRRNPPSHCHPRSRILAFTAAIRIAGVATAAPTETAIYALTCGYKGGLLNAQLGPVALSGKNDDRKAGFSGMTDPASVPIESVPGLAATLSLSGGHDTSKSDRHQPLPQSLDSGSASILVPALTAQSFIRLVPLALTPLPG
jgi:hypothetical protein